MATITKILYISDYKALYGDCFSLVDEGNHAKRASFPAYRRGLNNHQYWHGRDYGQYQSPCIVLPVFLDRGAHKHEDPTTSYGFWNPQARASLPPVPGLAFFPAPPPPGTLQLCSLSRLCHLLLDDSLKGCAGAVQLFLQLQDPQAGIPLVLVLGVRM